VTLVVKRIAALPLRGRCVVVIVWLLYLG